MQCMAHPTRAASNTCSKCDNWLCDDCTVEVNGRILCRSCITAMEGTSQPPEKPARPAAFRRGGISGLLLLILSCPPFPPGTNYMYMGLIKRGLAAMCGFFLIIYLGITTQVVLFWFLIPILFLTCFFDGFNTRRKINAGEPVEDGVGDMLNGILNNKNLAIAILVIIVLAFAGNIIGFAVELISRAIPLLLIILVLYIIFKRKS